MAAVTDKVIVELEARLSKYEANIRRAEQRFDSATASIQRDAQRMERQISRSTGAVGSQLRALAGTFAAAFSAREIAQLADGYTRFTNQLRVAGVEGEALAKTQNDLFLVAQKNGVELEQLGSLYGRVSQSAGDLGASQADILKLTEGVAAGLRVQGATAQQASGAILGLVQALGSSNIKAEEFNQINEGAPALLRAVAQNIDAAGGSISKLRALVVDGEITNQQFFRAFLDGTDDLKKQAESASLTIANSFTILNNALGKYIGETDQAFSATERISQGIIKLSENLDTVVPALGVLAAVLLGRVVSGLVAGAAASTTMSTAMFALQARAVGAATTMEALALASTTAGRAMLAAFGGPVGIAVTALAIGIGYLATESIAAEQAAEALNQSIDQQAEQFGLLAEHARQANAETNNLTDTERAALTATANLTGEADKLSDAWARVAAAAKTAAIEQARAVRDQARSNRSAADQALEADKKRGTIFGIRVSSAGADPNGKLVEQAFRAARNERAAQEALDEIINRPLAKFDAPTVAPVATVATGATVAPVATGPTPEELEARFLDDLERGRLAVLDAQADAIGTAEARRDVEQQRIEAERASVARQIELDDSLTAAQKKKLLATNDQVAAARQAALAAEAEAERTEQAFDLREADLQNQQDLLRAQARLAITAAERRDLELRLLDLQYEEEKARLQAVIELSKIPAEIEAARRRLALLDDLKSADQQGVVRSTQGPLERYRDKLNKTPGELGEEAEQLIVDEIEFVRSKMRDGITKALGVKDPLIAGLIDILLQEILFKPLAEALAKGAGSGGGLLGVVAGIITSISSGGSGGGGGVGRASGGHVAAGRFYRVTDGEGFVPPQSGKIIPLGRMRGAGGGNVTLQQTVHVDASGSVNPDGYADYIVSRVRKETVAIVGAGMQKVTKGVPARLSQFQRDGR